MHYAASLSKVLRFPKRCGRIDKMQAHLVILTPGPSRDGDKALLETLEQRSVDLPLSCGGVDLEHDDAAAGCPSGYERDGLVRAGAR